MSRIELLVDDESDGMRLDRYLADRLEGVSRSEIQRAIRASSVTVGSKCIAQPSHTLRSQDRVVCEIPVKPALTPTPLDLEIIYEDEQIVVVDKPAGLVVHPGAGSHEVTLVEALIVDRSLPQEGDPARPGVVHRLDKETSGIMVVGKTSAAVRSLKEQFARRSVLKLYVAKVEGSFAEDEGLIEAPIGRDQRRPRCMAINPQGRSAKTEFTVLRPLEGGSLILAHPLTGRTHQIRVHMDYIGHPVVGDRLYGHAGSRMFLHAWRLRFAHPGSEESMRLEALIPEEFPEYDFSSIRWP